MSLVVNERIKLLAGPIDRAATACFTVGVATPLAGYLDSVGNFGAKLTTPALLAIVSGWFLAILGLHLIALMPAFVVLCADVAMRVHEHWLHKQPGFGPNDPKG